nr:metalloregulator ArsR/SmtB family transcription factor [Deinobacterium chartae]
MMSAAKPLRIIKALAHETRYAIVSLLAQKELCVCDLEALLSLGQSKISYHLALLREVGLVSSEQRGKNAYYRLEREVLYRLGGELLADVMNAGRSGLESYETDLMC